MTILFIAAIPNDEKANFMGILTRKQGTGYVIGSDRFATDAPTTRAPKFPLTTSIAVWTGETWSAEMTAAMMFATLDDADEYVRANFSKVAGQSTPAKASVKRRVETAIPSPPVAEP